MAADERTVWQKAADGGAGVGEGAEAQHDEGAEDQTTGPAGVQDVEPVRLVAGIEGGRQRIDDRLAGAVGQ